MKTLKVIIAFVALALSHVPAAHADQQFDDNLKRMGNSFGGC
jgi:hypothetical protein